MRDLTSWAHIWCVPGFVLKTGCYNEEHNHLLYVLKASHDELKLAHEELSVKGITLDSNQQKDNSDLRVKTSIPHGQLTS